MEARLLPLDQAPAMAQSATASAAGETAIMADADAYVTECCGEALDYHYGDEAYCPHCKSLY